MRVGILGGTGPLGRGLGVRLAAAGVDVVIGSRHAERAEATAAEVLAAWPSRQLTVSGAANEEAAVGDLVVMATVWDAAVTTASRLEEQLRDKVVVSLANAIFRQGRELHALVPARGSLAAEVQAVLPDSYVAGAGHHLPAEPLADLDSQLEADVLVCADTTRAKEAALNLFGLIPGLRPLDAGSLASSGPIEAFTAVLATLNINYKARSSLRLAGLNLP